MVNSCITERPFMTAYNEAYALYIESRLEECETKACKVLKDPDVPRFYKLKTLVLLASVLGNIPDANSCWLRAETHWWMARREHPVGEDEFMDEQLAELREQLERFQKKFKKVEKEDEDALLELEWEDATDDEDLDETWELIEALQNDEAEMIDVELVERKMSDSQNGNLETVSLDFEIRCKTHRLHTHARPSDFPASRPCFKSLLARWEQGL